MGECPCKEVQTIINQRPDIIHFPIKNDINYCVNNTNDSELDLKGKLNTLENFKIFCNNKFPNLENLNLSSNNLTDISELKKLKAPKLKILDLSDNSIQNIDIFKELDFPLEELYLEGNGINNIEIFINAPILKNLKKLRLSVDLDDTPINNNILSDIKKSGIDFKCVTIDQANDKIIGDQLKDVISTKTL